MFIPSLLTCLAICGLSSAQIVGLLKHERPKITFIPYTPQQRQTVANYAKTLLEIYVNREVKIKNYGHEYPDIDPIPRIEQLAAKAANMSDRDFHYNMSSLFLSLRDGHASYQLPGPHRCFRAYSGLNFQIVQGGTPSNPLVVVSEVERDLRIRGLSPGLNNVTIGDQLVSIDGKTFAEFTAAKRFSNGGNNIYSSQRHALSDMSRIGGGRTAMPVKDSVKFVFKTRLTNRTFEVSLPWLTVMDDPQCYSESTKLIENITGKQYLPNYTSTTAIDLATQPPESNQTNSDIPDSPPQHIHLKLTDIPDVAWDIFHPQSENLGIIRFTSFPTNLPPQFVVSGIRNLLLNQLRDTNSVVIDMRGNTGGLGALASMIPQLFAVETGSVLLRSLNAGINKALCAKDATCNSTITASGEYFPQTELTPSSKLQTIGMAYLRPVGILNNAECYSSCDILSANMQDWDAGLIIGEDGQTGAGGAAVLIPDSNPDAKAFLPTLPFSDTNQTMVASPGFTVSWAQVTRQGKNRGALIEDIGVKSDVVIRPSIEDLLPNANDSSQLIRISQELAKYGQRTGKSNLFFMTDVDFQSTTPVKSALNWTVTSQGIASLTLQNENGSRIATLQLNGSKTSRQQTLWRIPAYETSLVNRIYTIIGKSVDGRVVLKTIRHVRYTSPPSQYKRLVPGESFKWDFSPSPHAVIYNTNHTAASDGWQKIDKTLAIRNSGSGMSVSANDFSTASLFFQVQSGQSLEIQVQADYDTGSQLDTLSFGAISNGTTTPFRIGEATFVFGNGTVSQRFNYTALSNQVEFFIQLNSFTNARRSITVSQFDVMVKA